MKIILKNFKCYENSSFNFGEKGLTLLSGPSGAGKCMAKNTNILLYDGTIKKIQDIKIGDKIMGDDSSFRTVLSTCKGNDIMYEIVPKKGKSYIVNSKHILTLQGHKPVCFHIKNKWVVRYMENSKFKFRFFKDKNNAYKFYLLLDNKPVNDISIEDFLKLDKYDQKYNYTYHVGVNFEEKEILVDSYLLGVWLGNKKKNQTSSFLNELNMYNLIGNKHIPYIYKTNSRNIRLQLLAGLIDTCGFVFNNIVEIVKKNKKFMEDIEYVALSLGFMAILEKKYISKTYYKVSIFGNINEIPTQKKLYPLKKATIHKFKINNIGLGEYYGFELDGNGRYLLGDFKVTHNSSILLGIYFALFGTGTKVTMYGKTTCSVSLEFDDLIMTRTKKPNRLVVYDKNIKYEDDTAQSIINKKFGDTFQTTGYISQNATNSFILMSPIEKLGFLEKFAFQDTDLFQIKTRCKNVINKRYETLLKSTSQLEIACAMVNELKKPEHMEPPFIMESYLKDGLKFKNNPSIITIEKILKNITIKYKNSNTLIIRCNKKIKILSDELYSLQLFTTKKISKQESLDYTTKKISDLLNELDNCNENSLSKLNEYQEQLSCYLLQKDVMSLQIKYETDLEILDNMKKQEFSVTLEKINVLKKKIWVDYTEEECTTNISEYKNIIKDLEKIKELQNDITQFVVDEKQLNIQHLELEETKKKLEINKKLRDKLELQKKIFQCPSCNTHLKFVSEKLQISEESFDNLENHLTLIDEIDNLTKKSLSIEKVILNKNNKLERYKEIEKNVFKITIQYTDDNNGLIKLPDLIEVKKDLEYMKKYINTQQEYVKQLNLLNLLKKQIETNQQYSNPVESFKNSILIQKKQIDSVVQKIGTLQSMEMGLDEEDIRNKIILLNKEKNKVESLKKNIKELNEEKNNYENQLKMYTEDYIKDFPDIRDIYVINSELTDQQKEHEELEKNKKELEKNIKNIEKYYEYKKSVETYITWTDKIKNIQNEEIENRKQYGAATMLKEKIVEAESIAMINIISSINTHSQVYLDSFFPDYPISVKLVPFKETKKGKNITIKPQINLQIEYKSMEADLTSLSGGETSRVILAFALALGEMFNTPMMLLDECTASLDQELTNEVMDGIRNNFNGKLVLIIAHQVIKGSYDTVVEIEGR